MFGLIMGNITNKKKIIHVFKATVGLNLEWCIQDWRQYRKKEIETLEQI